MPPPLPRSRTVSPAARAASALGLPHPSDALTASSGMTATSSLPYRFDVIGLQLVVPQQEASSPTRRARSAYFARTVSRTLSADCSMAMGSPCIDDDLCSAAHGMPACAGASSIHEHIDV